MSRRGQGPAPAGRRWCFTLNNYVENEITLFRKFLSCDFVRYAIFGYEKAPTTGTPHLQGYFSLNKVMTKTGLIRVLGHRLHLEKAIKCEVTNYEYCSKDGKFEEFGTRSQQGKHTEIDSFVESVKELSKDGWIDIRKLRDMHRIVSARYPRFFEQIVQDYMPKKKVKAHPLREWQQSLHDTLELPTADDRKVIFVVDLRGNTGKSWFSHWYCNANEDAQLLLPGKKVDMAYALRTDIRVLFIDIARTTGSKGLPYDFLEEVKNGYVFSTKYDSRMKTLDPVHVVVFMNEEPNRSMLSEDRYDVRRL